MSMVYYNDGLVQFMDVKLLREFLTELEECVMELYISEIQDKKTINNGQTVQYCNVEISFVSKELPFGLFDKYSSNNNFSIKGRNRFEGSSDFSIYKSEHGRHRIYSLEDFSPIKKLTIGFYNEDLYGNEIEREEKEIEVKGYIKENHDELVINSPELVSYHNHFKYWGPIYND